MPNFWKKLPSPIYALAPMEDVTDTVFRQIVLESSDFKNSGKRPVLFTEFTNCEGIQSVGQAKVIHRLKYNELERPIVAQVWGITPEDYYKTAKLVVDLGFDGMDINMGCPVKKVIKQGACSALIKNPSLAKEIVLATKEGLENKIPLSIKTRIGFNQIITQQWCGFLLQECKPAVLTVHGRTVKEESKVPNHWDEIGKVVSLRNQIFGLKKTKNSSELYDYPLIIGNGDILSLPEADEKIRLYDLDGIMIGRGIFNNPWLFNSNIIRSPKGILFNQETNQEITIENRISLLKRHLELWQQTWGESTKNYSILKKYFKIYINGFDGASQMRAKFMETKSVGEVLELL
jgi:tRNA-dihydrouridine synthase